MLPVNEPGPSALILEPGSARPIADIGQLLALYLDLHPADATARVRYGGGILVERGATEVNEEVAALLSEMGVRARVVPARYLEVPRGYTTSRLEILDEALCARLAGDRDLVILDSDLRGIQIHALEAEIEDELAAGEDAVTVPLFSAIKEGLISRRAVKILDWIRESGKPPPRFTLTLYARDPVGAVRLHHRQADYSTLGEEKRRHSLDNFLLLAEKLVHRKRDLINRDRVLKFLESLHPPEILWFKEEEVQNFDRWIQAWIRLEMEESGPAVTESAGAGAPVVPPPEVPPPEDERVTVPEPPGERGDSSGGAPAVREVCESLFEPERSSFDLEQIFRERYRGRTVRWSGILRSVDSYSFDFVFGNEPGVKAVLEIHPLPAGTGGGDQVHATVQLPRELADALRDRIGETVTVEGDLREVDILMRNLYIAGGAIG